MTALYKYLLRIFLMQLLFISSIVVRGQTSDLYSLMFTGNLSNGFPSSELLKKWNDASYNADNHAVVLLGNNYDSNENKIFDLLSLDNNHPLLLVPGRKEWDNGGYEGKEMIRDIQKKLNNRYKGFFYMPEAACPGPVEVILNDHLVVILIDSYWWVHKHDRRFNKCGIETNSDVLVEIEDAIRRHNPSKHVVIAAYHSLKSYGNSDGYFSLKQSILEAPYTLYRRVLGLRQDNHHPDFKGFRNSMLAILEKYPNVIYVSASDKNLQYFKSKNIHHIVSGSFAATEFVQSRQIEFGSEEKGFGRLDFSDNGDCALVFMSEKGEIFKKIIYQKEFLSESYYKDLILKLPDSIVVKASGKYNISEKNYFWMGKNYREVWNTPIKVPVFDIDNKKGGLKVIKRGGGMQTLSLRLEDKFGRQYVLRSVDKNVEGALPVDLKSTIAVDIIQDQISSSNPYAALVVANLAEYAGVFHSNPEIVYVPDDPRFGIYQKDVANKLFLFEEHINGNRSDIESFGYSKDIISTDEVIEKIFDDEDHLVDPESVIRARLFDILLNDWDRHDDQWRWASFKKGNKTTYKPIPRDRDQAFFVNEGVLPWIVARDWIMPKIQGFDDYTENIAGQYSYKTRYFDQTFLIYKNWQDWQKQIDSLKILLTDEKIDQAVLNFPTEVLALCANETAETLKARLNNMEPMARQLYLSLANEVEIPCTNKADLVEIDIPNDTVIHISAYHIKEKDEKGSEIYNRVFFASETSQILIYGFDKKDKFLINGNDKNKIKLIIVGGNNNDEIIYDGNHAPGFIFIYGNNNTDLSPAIKKQIVNHYDKSELKYNRETYKYDVVYPTIFLGYNQDDGIFLGGGADIHKSSRFKIDNYQLMANYGFSTSAVNLLFEAKRNNLIKRLEFSLLTDYKSPTYVSNYFGMGNETEWLVDKSEKEYYRLRMRQLSIETSLKRKLDKNGVHKAGLEVSYKNSDIEATTNRFISDFEVNNLTANDLLTHSYGKISFNYELNTRSNLELKKESEFIGSNMFPTRGIIFKTEFSQFVGFNNYSPDFSKIQGEWSSFFSFSQRPRIVYVVRTGGEKIFGNYAFSEAAILGQNDNLRGFRVARFYGDASFYLNAEIRIRAKQFNTYVLNGTAGLLFFNDLGRVWLSGESSNRWHNGYGIGFWFSPFDMALITFSYSGSKEDNLINFNVKYQF